MTTEAETRTQLIDRKLALAGWNVSDPTQVIPEFEIVLADAGILVAADSAVDNPYAGKQFADYVLLDKRGRPIAVIEAKKTSRHAAVGREQALQYAQHIARIHRIPLPFVLYTNGHDIYLWEVDVYPPVKVAGFPTRLDLEWMGQRQETRNPLSVELIDTDVAGRDYQIAAIRSILEGIESKRRDFLLVMATGTGKTRTAVALLDVLLRARWAKRVLFLVDRVALRDQALDAFEEHIPSAPRWPRSGERQFEPDRRVYVTTYPTMLNLIEAGTDAQSWLSPHFFDVVIADETHRSVYNIYKAVLDYFAGVKLGLTATPTERIGHDTFELFDCESELPTYAYTYEDALEHEPPWLCDYDVLKVRSKFQLEGIKGGTLPATVQARLVAEGKDVENIDFEGTDLERKVTNSGTNAVIVREFMEESIKDPSGVLPGKSIFFAISKKHAFRLQALFDRLYPEYAGKLAAVLVSEDSRVHGKGGLLDQFKTQPFPRVAISVDMLDTGVDVREVVNLVFAKPVYSYTKFWQMIGRGTRVLDDDPDKRRAWCPDKQRFLIIDCWGNFDFFKMRPKGREPGQQVPLPVRLFRARLDRLEAALAASRDDVAENTKDALRSDLAELTPNNVIVAENAAHLEPACDPSFWERLGADDLGYLRGVVAPVLRARSRVEIKALRFETDVVELSTALLSGNQDAFDAVQQSVVEQISELPLTVNVVARERDLIEAALTPAWWAEPTEEKLRELADRLAPLMRYRQRRRDPMMKLDLADLVAVKEWVEVGPEHERLTTAEYRTRVEAAVRALVDESQPLQRLRDGETLDDGELMELARHLAEQDPYVTEELLRKVYHHKTARFLQFLRHILGLETLEPWETTISAAFDAFIAEHNTLTALQIRFLQTLRTFVLQNGRVEKRDLIGAAFTQLHPQGIRGVFGRGEVEEVVAFARGLVA